MPTHVIAQKTPLKRQRSTLFWPRVGTTVVGADAQPVSSSICSASTRLHRAATFSVAFWTTTPPNSNSFVVASADFFVGAALSAPARDADADAESSRAFPAPALDAAALVRASIGDDGL